MRTRARSDGILLTFNNETTRDYQARQIYNFYLAYRILGDGRYLRWADDGAGDAPRDPAQPHTAAGETHTLFFAGFYTADGQARTRDGQVIDVNQNAEVALAYSLLYHDPASAFFLDPVGEGDRVRRTAGVDVDPGHGQRRDPADGHIPGADTAYGSYAAFSWVWCQLLWRDPTLRAAPPRGREVARRR